MFSLTELLEYEDKEKNNIAIKTKESSITYEELKKNIKKQSLLFSKFDFKNKGVAICLPNTLEYAISYFSILEIRGVVVPIYYNSLPEDIILQLKIAKSSYIITDTIIKGKLENLEEYLGSKVIDHNLYLCHLDGIKSEVFDDDIAVMLHSSGTSGLPKRIGHTHSGLLKNIVNNIDDLKIDSADKFLIQLPLNFGYANTSQFLTAFYLKASIYLNSSNNFMDMINILGEKEITTLTLVPSMIPILLEYLKRNKNYENFPSVKYIFLGGSGVNDAIYKKSQFIFPKAEVIQTYGQTEAGPRISTLRFRDYKEKPLSVGKPIKNVEIRINLSINSKGNIGEIEVNSPSIAKFIFTLDGIEDKKTKDGWLRTGDAGFIDKDGYLYLSGRLDGMVIVNGLNVFPEEIESIINAVPGIKESKVYSYKDRHGRTNLGAYLVRETKNLTYSDIIRNLKEKISAHKIPQNMNFVESLDKTYNNKIKRYNII